MTIGTTISFGDYEWKVLDIKENKVLLITDQIIEQHDYHDKKEAVTWEQSEIRNYLNTSFIDRFSSADKERILTTENRNADNPWYKSTGGNTTNDRAFLLSLDEVVRLYFGDSSRLLDNCRPSKHRRKKQHINNRINPQNIVESQSGKISLTVIRKKRVARLHQVVGRATGFWNSGVSGSIGS